MYYSMTTIPNRHSSSGPAVLQLRRNGRFGGINGKAAKKRTLANDLPSAPISQSDQTSWEP